MMKRVKKARPSQVLAMAAAWILTFSAVADGATVGRSSSCPIDRVVFKDRMSKRIFEARRVAVRYLYSCQSDSGDGYRTVYAPLKRHDDCLGPYGTMTIEGRLAGKVAYAMYIAVYGVPCCRWQSSARVTKDMRFSIHRWLRPDEVETEPLYSPYFSIETRAKEYDVPYSDKGPLREGLFIPVACN